MQSLNLSLFSYLVSYNPYRSIFLSPAWGSGQIKMLWLWRGQHRSDITAKHCPFVLVSGRIPHNFSCLANSQTDIIWNSLIVHSDIKQHWLPGVTGLNIFTCYNLGFSLVLENFMSSFNCPTFSLIDKDPSWLFKSSRWTVVWGQISDFLAQRCVLWHANYIRLSVQFQST